MSIRNFESGYSKFEKKKKIEALITS